MEKITMKDLEVQVEEHLKKIDASGPLTLLKKLDLATGGTFTRTNADYIPTSGSFNFSAETFDMYNVGKEEYNTFKSYIFKPIFTYDEYLAYPEKTLKCKKKPIKMNNHVRNDLEENLVLSKNFKPVCAKFEHELFDLMVRLEEMKCKAVIAGGCFRNWAIGKNEKDIDVFISCHGGPFDEVIDDLNEAGFKFKGKSNGDLKAGIAEQSRPDFYDEEFNVYEAELAGIESDYIVQLIFVHNFKNPKDFIETFDFDVNKGFAEIVVDLAASQRGIFKYKWNVSIEPIMTEIMNKTLTLNYSKISTYEWRTKRLVQRCQMVQDLFPEHKIVII